MTIPNLPEHTKWPITALTLLGRTWHADFYVDQVLSSRYMTSAMIKRNAHAALKSSLSYDY